MLRASAPSTRRAIIAMMALKDFAGIFSRAFVIGYFVPTFFALALLDQLLAPQSLPHAYVALSPGTQLLVLGGTALLLALLLSGLQHPILRLFEGYTLQRHARQPWTVGGRSLNPLRLVNDMLLGRQRAAFDHLAEIRRQAEPSPERTRAARRLDQFYPTKREHLLPTAFGNVVRAFEWHPRSRYNLDGVTVYPRIAAMLSDCERELVSDARTDVTFFVNVIVLSALALVAIVVSGLVHGLGTAWNWAVVPAMLAGAVGAYAVCVDAAERWGQAVRSSVDMHRLELYDKVGLRQPLSHDDETRIAHALNRCLLFGEPLPDDLRRPVPPFQEA